MSNHKSKKRKTNNAHAADDVVDTSRPSAIFKPTKGRTHTLSLALPGSIIANVSTPEKKTALAGQIARACAVLCVDEVIIYNDGTVPIRDPEANGYTAFTDPNHFLHHILSYLETPPHLRRTLFPMHPDLEKAGALPSLDMPHHLRSDEWCPYREAVASGSGKGGVTMVDTGLQQQVTVPMEIERDARVTVKLPASAQGRYGAIEAEAVTPDAPREEAGYYWGYSSRQAGSLGAVFTECPYDGGYDLSIGTSERGEPISNLLSSAHSSYIQPKWQHLLLVFGGVAGLEAAFGNDVELQGAGVGDVSELFDRWTNLVTGQGSRTIRTEEAVWIGLTSLRPLVTERDAL
ncbi:DUF171-domain-containing protein [Teratosphaeria nubilosa]|uniref:DUF171-domain-containing protein n=1 Tax=Teratosphaeria nubilosa TaxID=161662 RepID=A0A6G1L8Y9_9PEZI|nr:DUF171-domain-containing protein [Teratosphaeria nubilosa]